MDHFNNNRPPQWALAFFRWFCHPEFREDIEGDLLERFHAQVATSGLQKAKWQFVKEVFLLFRPGIVSDLGSLMQYKLFDMEKMNWFKLAAINLGLAIVIILPFLPGPPNQIVTGLSMFAQSAGFFGLLVVPIGVYWILLEIKKMHRNPAENFRWKTPYYLAIIAMSVIIPIVLLIGLAIFFQISLFAGAVIFIIGVVVGRQAIIAIKGLNRPVPVSKFHPMPFYLLTIPLIAFVTRIYVMDPMSDYSRTVTIGQSQELIDAIEAYQIKEGQYPASMQELEGAYLKKIPSPSIMGISDFRYNKINNHYSLSFSQWLELGSLEELVLYDKTNLKNNLTGEFAKYNYNFDLCRVKGAFASHNTEFDYWRYYLLD